MTSSSDNLQRSNLNAEGSRLRFLALMEERAGPPRPVRLHASEEFHARATLSIAEAAWELGVCTETAYRQAKSGQLPGAFKFGRRWIVSREAFERWLETR
jgi:excisionase family DNA binding protein